MRNRQRLLFVIKSESDTFSHYFTHGLLYNRCYYIGVHASPQASDRLLSQFQFERELGLKVYHGLKREGEATCCEDEMTANISVTSSQTPAVRNGTVYSKRTL